MSSITIHNLDKDLESVLRQEAESKHTSLNKVIKSILRESFGLDKRKTKKNDFSEFSGTWTPEEAKEFKDNIDAFDSIDKDLWK